MTKSYSGALAGADVDIAAYCAGGALVYATGSYSDIGDSSCCGTAYGDFVYCGEGLMYCG